MNSSLQEIRPRIPVTERAPNEILIYISQEATPKILSIPKVLTQAVDIGLFGKLKSYCQSM